MRELKVPKIGQKVRIKTSEELEKTSPHYRTQPPRFVDEMDQFMGKFTVIRSNLDEKRLLLDIDDGDFKWNKDWLVPADNTIEIDDNLFQI